MKIPKLEFDVDMIRNGLVFLTIHSHYGKEFGTEQSDRTFKNGTLADFFADVAKNPENIKKVQQIELDIYKQYGFEPNNALISYENFVDLLVKMKVVDILILNGIRIFYGGSKHEMHEVLQNAGIYYMDKAYQDGFYKDFKKRLQAFDSLMMMVVTEQLKKANPNQDLTIIGPNFNIL